MNTVTEATAPVRKSIVVNAPAARAFQVFTAGFDTWWPRTHHIGKLPMRKAIIEDCVGGRCYSEQTDGSECDWGQVLVWDPPRRFVIAWQINTEWQFEPDLAKSSEVEFRFTPEGEGATRVDLEHRHFERHGAGADRMRAGVDAPNGWSGLMQLFAAEAEGRAIEGERAEAIRRLEESAHQLGVAVAALTEAQWTYKPAADRWSIAECVEHVATVDERVAGLLNKLAQEPAGSGRAAMTDPEVLARVEDRSRRFSAPERIRPSGRYPNPKTGYAAFGAARGRLVEFVRTASADLRTRTAPHPILGDLDAHQWVLSASAHALRHLAQIEEIKAAPGYPRA